MNKNKYTIYGYICAGLFLLAGCKEDGPSLHYSEDAPYLESISAVFAGSDEDVDLPSDGDIEIPIVDPNDHTDNFEASELLNDFFHKDDILFFSQLVSGKLVPFQATQMEGSPSDSFLVPIEGKSGGSEDEGVGDKMPVIYPNIYGYYYDYRYESVWEDEPGGYNFFPNSVEEKMDWDVIKEWGLNNTGYALYALFYPYNNTLPIDENGDLNLMVEEDQTTLDKLRKSNFLGAYHSTSKADQRLKFKLYHLSCYLKVTLYIPVFNPHDKIIDDKGKEVEVRTGFPADALTSAEIRNVYNRFRINWYGGRSSDTAPITVVKTDEKRKDIKMYIPSAEEYKETDGLPPIVKIKLSDFMQTSEDLPEYDDCWKITLSALIPSGQDYPIGDEEYPKGQTWTDLNFLRFNFRQNIGEVPKSYVFNGNSANGLIGSGDPLNIGQGKLQHLNLYIPRYGAQAVLLNAEVIDWEHWYNDNMGLRKEDPINKDNPTDPADPGENE